MARRLALLVLVAGLLVLGLELYTRTPAVERLPDLALPVDARVVTLLIHGSGDGGDPLLLDVLAALENRYAGTPGAVVRLVDWAPASDQRLRAAANARVVGAALAEQLAQLPALAELRLVAHSSGAYMPDAICQAYRRMAARPARVEMEFLDPFQIQGFFDWTHGSREHGHCADFALAVINTDDNAPATNRPLQQAWNLDITADPGRRDFAGGGHYWPLRYYADRLAPGPGPAMRDHGRDRRGWVATSENPR